MPGGTVFPYCCDDDDPRAFLRGDVSGDTGGVRGRASLSIAGDMRALAVRPDGASFRREMAREAPSIMVIVPVDEM